jgi:hypothetical protein
MPDLAHLAIFVVLGAILGFLGGVFGIGGGVIAIPVLSLFFGMDQQHAQGTALVMVAPNVFLGLRQYARRGDLDRRVAVLLGVCAVSFTFLGALYATRVAGPGLRYGFATFLAVLCAYFAYRSLRGIAPVDPSTQRRIPWGWTSVVGVIGGILSGLFSVGGASFAVPVLSLVFGYSQTASQALSLALVAPGTLVGIATYAVAGDIDWPAGVALAAGGAFFVRYGVAAAYKLPERALRLLFCVLLAGAAIGLAFK